MEKKTTVDVKGGADVLIANDPARRDAERAGAPSERLQTKRGGWRRLGRLYVVLIVLAGVGFTALVALEDLRDRDRTARIADAKTADVLALDVETRVALYREALVGVSGFFEAGKLVDRADFSRYVEVTGVFERFPGVQALSWNPVVDTDNRLEFERSVQADRTLDPDGYPDFEVHPDPVEDDMFVVEYVVPLEGNEAAFGFDIGSNPVRRRAVEFARDTGEAVATAPITLVQEEGEQAGMLLLLPVYSSAEVGTSVERRENFRGVVVSVFRVGDLLSGANSQTGVLYRVSDTGASSEPLSEEAVVISGGGITEPLLDHESRIVDVAGRRWEIELFESAGADDGDLDTVALVVAGLVATLALGWAVDLVVRARDRAEVRAVELTGELRAANADIRQSNADLERFAHMASHDLQTPVRNIGNLVEMLRADFPADIDDTAVEYMDLLQWSASRMQALVQGLLQFSKIQSASDPPVLEDVDVNSLVKELIPVLRDRAGGDEVSVVWSGLPVVAADRQLLGLVFENLLLNAVKYRHPDRDIVISIEAASRHDEWVIAVTDNGMGIDSRFHERIFEMFGRLNPDTEYEGAGIGLALCRRIVERGGGEIWIESELGRGSKFLFTIQH